MIQHEWRITWPTRQNSALLWGEIKYFLVKCIHQIGLHNLWFNGGRIQAAIVVPGPPRGWSPPMFTVPDRHNTKDVSRCLQKYTADGCFGTVWIRDKQRVVPKNSRLSNKAFKSGTAPLWARSNLNQTFCHTSTTSCLFPSLIRPYLGKVGERRTRAASINRNKPYKVSYWL